MSADGNERLRKHDGLRVIGVSFVRQKSKVLIIYRNYEDLVGRVEGSGCLFKTDSPILGWKTYQVLV